MSDRMVFIVFHQSIAPNLTNTNKFSESVCYFGVNREHKKYILTSQDNLEELEKRSDIQLEYSLPYHDASLQKNGFMETSVYVHIYKNNLHLPYNFIGVTQYDMIWTDEAIKQVKELNSENEVLAKIHEIIFSEGQWHNLMFDDRFPLSYIIDSYNKHFKTSYTEEDLEGMPLTLWQTYFMHRSIFEELAEWLSVLVEEVYPWANKPPYPTHWGVLGGLTERAESIFFALRKDLLITCIELNHSEDIVTKLKINKEHYGSKQITYKNKNLKELSRNVVRRIKSIVSFH